MKKVLLFLFLINLSLFAQNSSIASIIESLYGHDGNVDYFNILLHAPFCFLIFSFFLILFLGIITPYIIISESKYKDYKNKKIFIIYEKATNILFFLHIILTLISILVNIFMAYFDDDFVVFIFIALIIGAIGIAIIYGIFDALHKNIYSAKKDKNDNDYMI